MSPGAGGKGGQAPVDLARRWPIGPAIGTQASQLAEDFAPRLPPSETMLGRRSVQVGSGLREAQVSLSGSQGVPTSPIHASRLAGL